MSGDLTGLCLCMFRSFEIRFSKSLDFKCFQILNVQISDPHCIDIYKSDPNLNPPFLP